MQNYAGFIILAAFILFFAWRALKFRSVRKNIPELIRQGAVVVDVRTPAEFLSGHAEGSVNIPLQELGLKSNNLDRQKTILLCCASGSRSGMAAAILKQKGFGKVVNAGPWRNLL